MGQLDGSVAIVTGAGRGIGRAIARVYAREGAQVAVVSRTRSTVDEVVAGIEDDGGVAIGITCDVGKKDEVFAAVEQTIATFGTVDILVNNAQGFGTQAAPRASTKYMGVEETPDDEVEYIFRTGAMATLWGMQAVFPTMKAKGWGKIINFTSTSGMLGTTGNTAYNVTKEAIRSLSKTAANEWGQFGINVNLISPTLKPMRSMPGKSTGPSSSRHCAKRCRCVASETPSATEARWRCSWRRTAPTSSPA